MSLSALRRGLVCRRNGLIAAVVLVLLIVLYGGYGHRWPWTGINGQTATLWDWLHLLLLPMAVAVVPLWLNPRTRVDRVSKSVVLAFTTVFAIIVIAGYTIPWTWTGFVGNSLWDWLNLIALPLAVAVTPILGQMRESWTPRHTMLALIGTVMFLAIVLAGYLAKWTWTGFTGNTLWDWLHLLLLPLLLPMFVVPALTPVISARMEIIEEKQEEQEKEKQGRGGEGAAAEDRAADGRSPAVPNGGPGEVALRYPAGSEPGTR